MFNGKENVARLKYPISPDGFPIPARRSAFVHATRRPALRGLGSLFSTSGSAHATSRFPHEFMLLRRNIDRSRQSRLTQVPPAPVHAIDDMQCLKLSGSCAS